MRDSERVRQVAERVFHRIGEVTPAGLGGHGWHFSRAYVQPREDPYLDALNAWAKKDTPDTRKALQRAAELYVGAWRRAGEEWEAAGCPAPDGATEVEAAVEADAVITAS
jgi:hypothetical protein